MRVETLPRGPAYRITTSDRRLQAHLQAHPFLAGPNEEMNLAGLALLRRGPIAREPKHPAEVFTLESGDLPPPAKTLSAARRLCGLFGNTDPDALIDDFYWKVACADVMPRKVLAFGCGSGDELVLLRAAFPAAEIHAVDWGSGPSLERLRAADVAFRQGHLDDLLGSGDGFDLIFSNHTVEHLYDPAAALARLGDALAKHGVLVSSLPLDGSPDDAFSGALAGWARNPSTASHLEMGWLDPGHPWKSNAADLVETLNEAGFPQVRLYQRADSLVRGKPFDEAGLRAFRRRYGILNRVTVKPLHAVAKPLAGMRPARRVLVGAETRVPWGDNRFKNAQSREIAFVARR